MFEPLTNPQLAGTALHRIKQFFNDHVEWFYTLSDGNAHAVRRQELDVALDHGKLILSCWTEQGQRSWHIRAWEWSGDKLLLEASRRMGAERPLIEIVPRASASSIAATVKAARLIRCEQLSQLACAARPGSRVEKASLSPGIRRGQPGKYARIVLRQKHRRIAVTGSVASSKARRLTPFSRRPCSGSLARVSERDLLISSNSV